MTRTRKRMRTNCGRASRNGSLRQTHLRTTILRVQLVTNAQQPGSFKGTPFESGRQRAHYFGYMENVCHV